MKRLKSLLPLLIAMILTVSIMFGSFGVFAFAEDETPAMPAREFFASTITVDDEEVPVTNVMETRVKEGEYFQIPVHHEGVEYKITNPVGLRVDIDATESDTDNGVYMVRATMLGNYTVTYYKGNHKYSYNVLCYEDRDYYMQVTQTKDNFLPTFAKKGTEIILPAAADYNLVYKNSKGEVVEVENAITKVTFSDDIAEWNAAKTGIKLIKSGTLVITFEGKLGENTTKKFTKEFTVSVQDNFKNESAPTLGQLSVSSTANVNSLYTVPTATASDSYDSKVFVDVEVLDPKGEKVLDYEADENGYAIVPTNTSGLKPVAFDNNEVRSFYPTQTGIYTIKYTAYNGGGSAADRKSSGVAREYTVECRDKLAPVFVSVDSDKIPTKWGLNSVNKSNAAGTGSTPASTEFVIPFPTFADNADIEDDLTVNITIANAANRTLARWEGTVAEYMGEGASLYSTITYNSYFRTGHTDKMFKVDKALGGMKFDFSYFNLSTDRDNYTSTTSRIDTETEKFGDWTITYTVKDTSDNGGSGSAKKSYTVNLAKTFTETDGPSIDEYNLDIPKYILINSESSTFTVPVIKMNSGADTDITFSYNMTSEPIGTFTEGAKVVSSDNITYTATKSFNITRESTANTIGGKEYTVEKIGDNHYVLIAEKGVYTAFILGANVKFDFIANDDVGNTFTLDKIETEGIVTAIETEDDETEYRIVIDILNADVPFDGEYVFDFDGFEPNAADIDENGKATQNKTLNLGGFVVKGIDVDHVDYTGIEISINDIDGEPVSFNAYTYNLLEEFVVNEEEPEVTEMRNSIYVKGLRVTPKKVGIHTINVRVYDISGKSIVHGFTFDVKAGSKNGGIVGTAAKVEDTGAIATEYELEKNYWTSGDPDDSVIVRAISGFTFRIMNNIFTGLEGSTYRVTDYVVGKFADFNTWTDDGLKNYFEQSYTISITNSEKPVIEFHDVVKKFVSTAVTPDNIEEYKAGDFIELPIITGYSKFENATIDVTVTYKGATVNGGVKKIFYKLNENGFKATPEVKVFENEIEEGKEDDYVFSGIFAFAAAADGDYAVSVNAKVSSGDATQSFNIKVGDRTPVSFTVDPVTTATVGSEFKRAKPSIDGDYSKITITLRDPNGKIITDAGLSLDASVVKNSFDNYIDSGYKFTDAGPYTIIYTVYNQNDDSITSIETFTLEVTGSGSVGSQPPVALTAVLIIVGVLLIVGVIVYVIRFRAVKK